MRWAILKLPALLRPFPSVGIRSALRLAYSKGRCNLENKHNFITLQLSNN